MKWPPYRSNIIIELWKSKEAKGIKDFQVQFIYNANPLGMKWCTSGTCNQQEFLNYLDNDLGLVSGWDLYLSDLDKRKLVNFEDLC
jgi:hypothetical protein